MKTRVLQLLAACGAAAFFSSAHAATTSGNFTVNINLTAGCALSTPGDVNFNYTSFQATAATSTGGAFNVTCTTGLGYTMALTGASVTDDAVNLGYTLTLSAAGGTGTGVAQPYAVNGSMPASQGGTCAAATCTNAAATNKAKTLTITY